MNNIVVCIGDSLTNGKGWLNGSDLNKTLNVRLSIKYPGLSFINLGINGETTSALDARKSVVNVYNPFRVIVWEGINDIASGESALNIQTNLQNIYTYYHNQGYEVWGITITPKDDDNETKNLIRYGVNNWILNQAQNIDVKINAWLAIRDPSNIAKRLFPDPNTPNHITDDGMAAIVNLFPKL